MNAPLENLHVLITRPKHQADNICVKLESVGATISRLPVIEIASIENTPAIQNRLRHVYDYNTVIFISSNAVNYALQLGGTNVKTGLSQCNIGAIGLKTNQTLAEHGLGANIFPKQGFTSEDYLALAMMQPEKLAGAKILIIRGEGGRELLAETLIQRGATVDYLEVYRRICPHPDTIKPVMQRQTQQPIDIITITSNEGLHNLLTLFQAAKWLKTTPLLLGSDRMARDAMNAGFTASLVVAADPSDDSMHTALLQWRQEVQQ